MGYPTAPNATARSRSATGLSDGARYAFAGSVPGYAGVRYTGFPKHAVTSGVGGGGMAPSGWQSPYKPGVPAQFAPPKLVPGRIVGPAVSPGVTRTALAGLSSAFSAAALAGMYGLALWQMYDQMLRLGGGAPEFPPGTTSYCTGTGSHQGTRVRGSCGDLSKTDRYPPVTTFGWTLLGGNWHWMNIQVGQIFGPYENPDANVGFETCHTTVVGHWSVGGAEPAPPNFDVGRIALPDVPEEHAPAMIDPNSVPPMTFPPFPVEIPYGEIPHRRPNPFRSPTESGNRGPVRVRRRPRDRRRYTKPSPPPKGTKEQKIDILKSWIGRVLYELMGVTEADDLIDALWEALPDSAKTSRRARDKWADVFRHLSEVNFEEALENLIINAIEDRIIGMLEGRIDQIKQSPFGDAPRPYQNPALSRSEHGKLVSEWVDTYIAPIVRDLVVKPGTTYF